MRLAELRRGAGGRARAPPAPDARPAARRDATLGGIVATNASGPLRHRYGAPRDLVIGARFVLADGTRAKTGGRVVKNVAGYDLAKLLCGSLGTLAVITEVAFRLHPVPDATAPWCSRRATPAARRRSRRPSAAPALAPTLVEAAWPDGRAAWCGSTRRRRRAARAGAGRRGARPDARALSRPDEADARGRACRTGRGAATARWSASACRWRAVGRPAARSARRRCDDLVAARRRRRRRGAAARPTPSAVARSATASRRSAGTSRRARLPPRTRWPRSTRRRGPDAAVARLDRARCTRRASRQRLDPTARAAAPPAAAPTRPRRVRRRSTPPERRCSTTACTAASACRPARRTCCGARRWTRRAAASC